MEDFKYIIQMHRNKINNKVYIGQTHLTNINRRFRGGHGYKGSPHFYKAIQKYGWDNFEHIVLECNISKIDVNEREKQYIKKYKATDPQYGYNIQEGGRCKVPYVNSTFKNNKRIRCKETGIIFDSMVQASLYYGYSKEFASNISSQAKGLSSYAGKDEYGNPLHWEFVDNITENKPPLIPKKGGALPVKCLETGKIYDSVNEAAKDSGMSVPTITKSCRSNGEIGVSKNVKKELRVYTHWIYI